VFEARVGRSGVDEVRHRQLADSAKPLEDRRINRPPLVFIKRDELVDRIPNALSPRHIGSIACQVDGRLRRAQPPLGHEHMFVSSHIQRTELSTALGT
jgi:hypothetical protein